MSDRVVRYSQLPPRAKVKYQFLWLRHKWDTLVSYLKNKMLCYCCLYYTAIEEDDSVLVTRLVLEAQRDN